MVAQSDFIERRALYFDYVDLKKFKGKYNNLAVCKAPL
jgi:hypothetical protein